MKSKSNHTNQKIELKSKVPKNNKNKTHLLNICSALGFMLPPLFVSFIVSFCVQVALLDKQLTLCKAI
jgi:hypothetical protein